MIYEIPTPPNYNPEVDDAGSVHQWLASQGCTVTSVSIVHHDDALVLSIEADDNPAPYIAMFPRTRTKSEAITEALDALDLDNINELKSAVHLLRAALGV